MFSMNWNYLIIALIVILLVPYIPCTHAKNEKISSDLDITNSASQKVIIHYTAVPTIDNQNIIKGKKGKVHRTFTVKPLKNIFAAEIPGDQIELLVAADSSIKSIDPDYEVHALLSQSVPLITVPEVWSTYSATGKGIKVAVLDTGISDHPALTVQQHLSFNGESVGDFHGHGTHVAGIIASHDSAYKGVAPDVELYDLKVLNQYGLGSLSDILAAMEWAVAHDIDVMSMSFGAWIYCDGQDIMSQMVDYAETMGVHSVVAAGNSGPSSYSIESPGCARHAITVGSTSKSDTIAYTSSRGPTDDGRQKPDIVAPGVSITSLWNNGGFNTISGTSMATPHITGAVALLLQDQGAMTRSQIIDALGSTAKNLGYDGNTQGAGRIAVYNAFQKLHPTPIDNPPVISQIIVSPLIASSSVQISFDVSESATVAVTVNEKSATFVSLTGLHYIYTYPVSSADTQGTATINIRATDSAGQTGTATSTDLIIDTQSPTNAAVAINNDATTTSTPAVVLTLYATDATTNVATMALSNDGTTYGTQESYTTSKQWILSEGYGQKTVYTTFFDKAGNSAVASDTIEYTSSSECSVDSDCASGETCESGICIPNNEDEQYIKLKEKLDKQYEQKLAELNDWYKKRLEELTEKYQTPETPEPTPEPIPEPEPTPEPTPEPEQPTQTTFGPIKYYEAPQTWQFTVPSGASKVEVVTYAANNPSRLDAYGGWTAYLKINGIEMWENTPTTTTDYTTGQTYPVNAGYGLGKWVDVTKYVTSGTNSLTYYHFNEGDGLGIIVKITPSTSTGASITGFAIFPFLQKSNPCGEDTVLCIAFP